ncbi:MAG: YrvL family regulatory protein [Bacillaceae bacterium]
MRNELEQKEQVLKTKKEWIGVGVLVLIFMGIVLTVVGLGYLGLLTVFGFEYESYEAIFLFLVYLLLFGLIVEGIVFVFRVMMTMVFNLTDMQARFIGFLVELQLLFFLVDLIDEKMASITISETSQALFVVTLGVIDYLLLFNKNKSEN